MNIIFGKENAEQLKDKYTVLELDTIQFPNNGPVVTAYCVVEKLSLGHLPMIETMSNLHQSLIIQYKQRNWATCQEIVSKLMGFWNGELDSFYQEMLQRITTYQQTEPDSSWTPVIIK